MRVFVVCCVFVGVGVGVCISVCVGVFGVLGCWIGRRHCCSVMLCGAVVMRGPADVLLKLS